MAPVLLLLAHDATYSNLQANSVKALDYLAYNDMRVTAPLTSVKYSDEHEGSLPIFQPAVAESRDEMARQTMMIIAPQRKTRVVYSV